MKGKLEIVPGKAGQINYVLRSYNQYFDELLRTQRLILRGQLAEAKRLIERTNNVYDPTYGTLVLSGLIAALENNPTLASEHFRMAKSLYPDEEALNLLKQ